MIESIFGQYLVTKGKLSEDTLAEVLEKQDSTRVKMGLMAVAEGMMTTEQADEVNRLQAVKDMRFGDIAVEMGYLTDEQVGTLLKKQGNTYLSFVQAILDKEAMTMEEVNTAFDAMAAEEGYTKEDQEALKSDDPECIVPLLVPAEAKEYALPISTAVKAVIRLIDRRAYVGKAKMIDEFPATNQVNQSLAGENGLVAGLVEGCGALVILASVFGKEEFTEVNADSLDAAGEFLNCANGLFVSRLSRQGEFLELMPPCYEGCADEVKAGTICSIPVHINNRCLNYVIARI